MSPIEIAASLVAMAMRVLPDLADGGRTSEQVLARVQEILGEPADGQSSQAERIIRLLGKPQ